MASSVMTAELSDCTRNSYLIASSSETASTPHTIPESHKTPPLDELGLGSQRNSISFDIGHDSDPADIFRFASRDNCYCPPVHHEYYNSDSNQLSPWSQKVLLALDGGGIRGLSSLLVLQKLMRAISEIESRQRKDHQQYTNYKLYKCSHSGYYRWLSPDSCAHQGSRDSVQPLNELNQFTPHHYLDYMAGTSTGGLSVIMLSRFHMNIEDAIKQYDLVGNDVFGHPKTLQVRGVPRYQYRAKYMKTAILGVVEYGLTQIRHTATKEDLQLQDDSIYPCKTIVVSYGGDTKTKMADTYLHRSYHHMKPDPDHRPDIFPSGEHFNPGENHQEPIWKIARATSAAPGYFKSIDIDGYAHKDGGIGANNPALLAYNEVCQMHRGQEPNITISIGTGLPIKSKEDGPSKKVMRGFRQLKGLWDTIGAMQDIVTDSEKTHEHLLNRVTDRRQVRGNIDGPPYYYRFNVEDIADIPLDQWKPSNSGELTKDRLKALTDVYLKKPEVEAHILQCAAKLVELRQRRSDTERWEKYGTDVEYTCRLGGCQDLRDRTRSGLRRHLVQHGRFLAEQLAPACANHRCSAAERLRGDGSETNAVVKAHLESRHGFAEAELMTPEDVEIWLDRGRVIQRS